MQKQELLRGLPKIDEVLRQESLVMLAEEKSELLVTEAVREVTANLRAEILSLTDDKVEQFEENKLSVDSIVTEAKSLIAVKNKKKLFSIINATGTILHTNLGRAPLSKDALDSVAETSAGYSSLEYNVAQGKRGSRHDLVSELIKELTGAEDAIVVNNNAAATMLVLAAIGKGKEIIVSRGELVEIGGSFRIPDIMKQSGAYLMEVGTSNKTRAGDYEDAIITKEEIEEQYNAIRRYALIHNNYYQNEGFAVSDGSIQSDGFTRSGGNLQNDEFPRNSGSTQNNGAAQNDENLRRDGYWDEPVRQTNRFETGALMKVHKSNYDIVGFTEEASLEELVDIGHKHELPVIFDMGNGLMLDMTEYGLTEPNVPASLSTGIDVILFSGDKLLGGPQAGIIAGKKEYIKVMKKHPLARALRVDKMTFAALEATLMKYRDPKIALRDIPVLRMIASSGNELKKRAEKLADAISKTNENVMCEIVRVEDQIGGGSAPTVRLPGFAVAVQDGSRSADRTEKKLREAEVPVVARINEDRLLLAVRTIADEEIGLVAEAFR